MIQDVKPMICMCQEQYQDDNNLFSGDSLHPNCQGDEVQVKRFKMTPNQPISGIK